MIRRNRIATYRPMRTRDHQASPIVDQDVNQAAPMPSYVDYRIAPELRRCCWYTIVALVPLTGIFAWVARVVQQRGVWDVALTCGMFCALGFAALVPLRWRVRRDDRGLSRRVLLRWDRWSWEDLASGRIGKLHPITLYDPTRPWGRRKLRLGYLTDHDIDEVIDAVNAHYRLPPPPVLSGKLTIKYGLRRTLTLDHHAIQLARGSQVQDYAWPDVLGVYLTRMDPLRRDFVRLAIVLPDNEVELRLVSQQGSTSAAWSGATADQINEFLHRTVPEDRIHLAIADRVPTDRQHLDRRLRELQTTYRQLKTVAFVFAIATSGIIIWTAVEDGWGKALWMGGMLVVLYVPVLAHLLRSQRVRRNKLEDAAAQRPTSAK